MSLVFAAITPHPPLLIPTIGKDALKKINQTQQALERLEEELYLARPDIIIIISPHGHLFTDAFSINLSTVFKTNLREFGDLATNCTYKGEIHLPGAIRSLAKQRGYETTIITNENLDHGITIPLYYLTAHLPEIKIMPIGYCNLDHKTHLEFGYLMKDPIMKSSKRIAIIASGDLSHALTTDAPAGFNPAGEKFDKKIQELLATHNSTGMVQLDPQFVNEATECGLRSFLILLGVLRDMSYRYESYAYEAPFGVGYLTANFIL